MDVALPPESPTAEVLVVDDEPMLADLLSEWVREKWHCEVVTSGSGALEAVDGDTDVVLLDRQLPVVSGEDVLARLREAERAVQVLMVSSLEPDFDLLDLPIDGYLRKPVTRPTLQGTVEELLVRRTYEPTVERYFVCAAKLDALESAKSATDLAEHEGYLALRTMADDLRQSADATLGQLTDHVAEFHDVPLDD